jgi:hypothetical protein
VNELFYRIHVVTRIVRKHEQFDFMGMTIKVRVRVS